MSAFDTQITELFSNAISARRLPHAVLIEGGTNEKRQQAVQYLSQVAVCSSDKKPCMECANCIKASHNSHSDIYVPKLSGKTNIIRIEAIRDLIKDASIIPNEADTKVFILYDVDKTMSDIVQNAFLKILEEPPQSTLFILTAESSGRMLPTILSRVQTFSLKNETSVDENIDALAREIIDGILSPNEVKLLYATVKLNTKPLFKEVLCVVCEYLRMGLSKSVGADIGDEKACAIAKKLTKTKIIALVELSSKAIIRADRNVNMTLLNTWLCGEYRRISWLR